MDVNCYPEMSRFGFPAECGLKCFGLQTDLRLRSCMFISRSAEDTFLVNSMSKLWNLRLYTNLMPNVHLGWEGVCSQAP